MHVYQIDEDKKSFHLNTAEPEADDGHPEASKPLVTSCALWHRQALDPTLRRACHPSVSPQRLFTWTELVIAENKTTSVEHILWAILQL